MTAQGITLDSIRPLVADQKVNGRRLIVQFRCPRSGKTVQATWSAPASNGVGNRVAAQAKRSAWWEVRRQVNSTLRSVLGRGAMANIAVGAVNTAFGAAATTRTGPAALSASEQEQGLVEAFKGVASQFVWVDGGWMHGSAVQELLSPFDAQMAAHPVDAPYDRKVLARMLAEVAGADGEVSAGERELLMLLLDGAASVDALLQDPPLTPAELDETSAGGPRISMLAIAWTVALCDDELDPGEAALLERLADGLRLSTGQRAQAKELGCSQLLDQLLEHAFASDRYNASARDHLYTTGQNMGLDQATIQKAEARFRKRKGL